MKDLIIYPEHEVTKNEDYVSILGGKLEHGTTNNRKSFGSNTNIVLFNQVSGICPLCYVPLMNDKNSSKYKNYELAHIYPLNPKPEELIILRDEERLSDDVDHEDNLIPLCRNCHGKFDNPRTVSEYKNLVRIKKELLSKQEQQNMWHQYVIEADIEKIINSLCSLNEFEQTEEIEFEPKEVERKTQGLNNLIRRKIKNNVTEYFSFIKTRFAAIDSQNEGVADIICLQVKTYYKKQKQKGLSQQEIYENICDWLMNKTNSNTDVAVDILVSFFVQNCEVFE